MGGAVPAQLCRASAARGRHLIPGGIVKKLRLEDIHVESYTTHTVASVHGTVQANMATLYPALCSGSCPSAVATDCNSCATNQWCC
jgi:hypothetical protein